MAPKTADLQLEGAASFEKDESKRLAPSSDEVSDDSCSDESRAVPPNTSDSKEFIELAQKAVSKGGPKKTLKDRSKIPGSAYVTVGIIIGLQYFSGLYANVTHVLTSLKHSVTSSSRALYATLVYLRDLCQSIASGQAQDNPWEYVFAFVFCALVASLCYVLLVAPLWVGMWTGTRAKRHRVHRYFGLAFLIQYALAWIEYLTNYEDGYRNSYLVHTIAINGA
jgi:hypothetical protein